MSTLWQKKNSMLQNVTHAELVKLYSGGIVRPMQDTGCTTENVVYLISCNSCNKQYVGEAKGPLNKCMNDHRYDLRQCMFEKLPTAEHFRSANHDFLSHASVCCLTRSGQVLPEKPVRATGFDV